MTNKPVFFDDEETFNFDQVTNLGERSKAFMSKKLCWRPQKWASVCSSFAVLCAVAVFQPPVQAVPTTATSISKAPYSRVFFTGSAYAVKDHDFKGDNPALGFSTLWIENPDRSRFHVGVRYCLPDQSLADRGTSLTSIVLMNNDQPLVTIDRRIKATSAQQKFLQTGYSYQEIDPFWENNQFYNGIDPLWGNLDNFGYNDESLYRNPVTCSAGSSRFDISQLADAIAQLPNKTLQVKLVFSDGATSNWRLGDKTVRALKDLLTIRQTPTSPKPRSSN